MRIALVYNLNRGQSEYETEFDSLETIDALAAAIGSEHEVERVESDRDIATWVTQLQRFQPDLVFNVSEGYYGAAREAVVPAICDQIGLSYSGPGPQDCVICLNKALSKQLVGAEGVCVAKHQKIGSEDDFQRLNDLEYPAIVKPNESGSSLGIGDGAIVGDASVAASRCQLLLREFDTDVLVEEFVPGHDLSVTFLEGRGVFGPVQYIYPNSQIYDFNLKAMINDQVAIASPRGIALHVLRELRAATLVAAKALNVRGYGRADFRVRRDGSWVFLEFNAQVSFHIDGAFIRAVIDETGKSYAAIILQIIEDTCKS